MKKLMLSLLLLVCLFALNVFANDRQPGTLAGRIIDETTQQPVAGASVIILDTNMGTFADEGGMYEIKNIPVGSYSVKIMRIGYKPVIKPTVIIKPGSVTNLIMEMKVQAIKMEGVDVRASYFDKSKDAIVSTRTMDYEEIREQAGGIGDVQRVMQALPAVVSAADQENDIIVRGGNYGENLFLMDQIEIDNPNHFGHMGSGGGPISMINTEFVREVDFMAGAFPAKYGDKASSVMDISLREGNRKKNTLSSELSMAGAGGVVEGPIDEGKGSYIFSARKSFVDLIIESTGMTAVPKYYSLQGKVVYDVSRSQKLIFNGIYGNDNIHIEPGEEDFGDEDLDINSKSQRLAVGATLKSLFSSRGYSLLTLFTSRTNWNETVVDVETDQLDFDTNSVEQQNTLKSDIVYLLKPNFEIGFGGFVKQIDLDYDMKADNDTLWLYFNEQGLPRTDINDAIADSQLVEIYDFMIKHDKKSYKYGGYWQFKYLPISRLSLYGGIRYDYFDFTEKGYISPRGGLSVNVMPETFLNFAYGRHYQSPSFYELTRNPANKSLKSKYTDQCVVGIEHYFADDVKATLEVYQKDYYDVPVPFGMTTPEPNDPDDGLYINEGTGQAQGVELFIQKKLSRNFYGTLSYSYSVAEADDPRYPGVKYDWDFDYRHVFTAIGGYRINMDEMDWYNSMKEKTWYKFTGWLFPFGDELQLGAKWRYLGGRPYTPYTYHPEHKSWELEELEKVNPSRLPEYHRLDVRVDRRFFFNNWSLVTFLEIENLYNHHNIWDYEYEDDGTTETIYQFETMPVGGINIEF